MSANNYQNRPTALRRDANLGDPNPVTYNANVSDTAAVNGLTLTGSHPALAWQRRCQRLHTPNNHTDTYWEAIGVAPWVGARCNIREHAGEGVDEGIHESEYTLARSKALGIQQSDGAGKNGSRA